MPTTVALLITAIVAAAPTGWLGDGTGHFEGSVPTGWSADAPGGWVTSLSDWSNASPVVVGEKVCVTIEPLSVVCLSTATGKQLWSHEVTYLDTVVAADRPRVAAEQAEAQRLAEALRSKERELNKLKRELVFSRMDKKFIRYVWAIWCGIPEILRPSSINLCVAPRARGKPCNA